MKREGRIFVVRSEDLQKRQVFDGKNFFNAFWYFKEESKEFNQKESFVLGISNEGNNEILKKCKQEEKRLNKLGYNILSIEIHQLRKEQVVIPGLIDAHVHVLTGSMFRKAINLEKVKGKRTFRKILNEFMKSKTLDQDEWIIGYNYNDSYWDEPPHKDWIDDLTGNHPTAIFKFDAHSVLLNSQGLISCGIDKNSVPKRGIFVKSKNGELTGEIKDELSLVMEKIPKKDFLNTIKIGIKLMNSLGITTVCNMGSPFDLSLNWEEYNLLQTLKEENELFLRVYHAIGLPDHKKLFNHIQKYGRGDNFLKLGLLKGFIDGSLGSKTALQFYPYLNEENNFGIQLLGDEEGFKMIKEADDNNLQIAIHAIGDKGSYKLLKMLEKVRKTNGKRDRRFRIEHLQQIRQQDFSLLKENNILPVMNPGHIEIDEINAKMVLSPKSRMTMHREKEVSKFSSFLSFGSDFPVVFPDPFNAIYNLVKYKNFSVTEAIEGFTWKGAFSGFQEKYLGKLQPDMKPDFVILDKDIFNLDKIEKIKECKVLETFINGTQVFKL